MPGPEAPIPPGQIDDELKSYLDSGPSILIGTCGAGLAPDITRAWGPRVSEDRRSLSVCLPRATSGRALYNLAHNPRIAIALAVPTTVKSVQLKGACIEIAEPDAADLAAVEQHHDVFAAHNARIGIPRERIEVFWRRELETSADLVKIRMVPDRTYDQTPGPDAGSPR